MQKVIKKEVETNNIKFQEGVFYIDSDVISEKFVLKLLKKNTKISQMDDDRILDIIKNIFTETIFEVSDDKIVKESMGKVELTLNDLGEFTPDDKTNLSEHFRWCKTQDGQVIYHVVKNNLFHKIPQTLAGKFLLREVLEYTDLHNELLISFENLLRSWKKSIIEIANRNFDELDAWIYQNIPQIILQNFEVSLRYKEVKNTDRTMRFYQYVEITKNQKNITFLEYIEELFETYGTAVIKQTEEPKIYTNSHETPAYHFFDVSPFEVSTEVSLSESWEEAFSKYTEDEKEIMLAWIWGVFYEPNRTRAALYNLDLEGYTGKSAMIDAITEILGTVNAGVLQKDSLNNQFGLAKVWDKRIIVFPDSKNQQIIRSEKIHMLLGSDMADIEEKGQKSFSKKLNSKIWINSNISPIFDSEAKHEDSRIIIVKPKMSQKVIDKLAYRDENGNIMKDSYGKLIMVGDANFSTNLCLTSASMLVNAYQMYKKLCPANADFIIPESVRQNNRDIQPVEIGNFETIFDGILLEDKESFLVASDLYKNYISFCNDNFEYRGLGNARDYSDFLSQYVEKNRKFKKIETKIDGKRTRGYKGLTLKYQQPDFLKNIQKNDTITISDESTNTNTSKFFEKLGGIS